MDPRNFAAYGEELQEKLDSYSGSGFSTGIMGEVLARYENHVSIDKTVVDAWDIPVLHIETQVHRQRIQHGDAMRSTRRCELAEAAGFEVLTKNYEPNPPGYSIHELGTCRMGDDPKTSVLNKWYQSHDIKNLFVVDGGSFVSGGWQNPTMTISGAGHARTRNIWRSRCVGDLNPAILSELRTHHAGRKPRDQQNCFRACSKFIGLLLSSYRRCSVADDHGPRCVLEPHNVDPLPGAVIAVHFNPRVVRRHLGIPQGAFRIKAGRLRLTQHLVGKAGSAGGSVRSRSVLRLRPSYQFPPRPLNGGCAENLPCRGFA